MVVSGSTAGGILADVASSNSVTAFNSDDLEAIGVTPEIYMRKYSKGAFTNPDPAVRADVIAFLNEAADLLFGVFLILVGEVDDDGL